MARSSSSLPWDQSTKALVEYRLENYANAIAWAENCLRHPNPHLKRIRDVPALLISAMAHQRLGRHAEAPKELADARDLFSQVPEPITGEVHHWHDWYIAEILMSEATQLIRPAER